MSRRLNVIIEKDEFGYFAFCPELEGCHSQGDTLDEVLRNIKEAMELYIETLSKSERKKLSVKEMITTSFEVSLA